jgi:acylphosphatase
VTRSSRNSFSREKTKFISARIFEFVSQAKQGKRYFVSGSVQGVGFRYFAQRAAEKLSISGYVRNLRDGRVEIYAIGAQEQLSEFKNTLKNGSSFSNVQEVREETASLDAQFESTFVILPTA